MDKLYCQCMTLIILLLILNIGLVIGVYIKWHIARKKCNGGQYRSILVRNRTEYALRKSLTQDYPFGVRIFVNESNANRKLYCGGATVGKSWVMTAGHCIETLQTFPLQKITVSVGGNPRDFQTDYNVILIMHHRNYSNLTYDVDIGLLKIQDTFIGSLDSLIAIPDLYKYKDNVTVIALGWTNYYEEKYKDYYELQNVNVTLLDRQYCSNFYKGVNEELTEFMFCAGSYLGVKPVCRFRPGSFLLDGKALIGISSWSNGCGKVDEPIVYTKVALLKKWIYNTMRNN